MFGAAFLGYVYWWRDVPILMSDSWGYMRVAADLADGSIDQLQNRTPGYPLILLLTRSQEAPSRWLLFLSLILHFSSIWIVGSVMSQLGFSWRAVYTFSAFLLLPPFVEPAAYVLAENLTEFMLAVSFSSLVFWLSLGRSVWLLLAVFALAFSALTRPTYQLLPLVLSAFVVIAPKFFRWPRRTSVIAIAILLIAPMLFVFGYALTNYEKFGFFGISPMVGVHLSTRTSRVVERLPDEYAQVREILIKARDADLVEKGGLHDGYGYLQKSGVLAEVAQATGLKGAELARYLVGINLMLIRSAPQEYLSEVAQAFSTFWFPASTNLANMSSRSIQLLWSVLHFVLMFVFGATLIILTGSAVFLAKTGESFKKSDSAVESEVRLIRQQGAVYALAGSIVMYGAVVTCLFESGNPRYRVPTDILIVFMSFLGVAILGRLARITTVAFKSPKAFRIAC